MYVNMILNKMSVAALRNSQITPGICANYKTVGTIEMKLRQNWNNSFKTVSKLFWNCYVSVCFNCADSLKQAWNLIAWIFVSHC